MGSWFVRDYLGTGKPVSGETNPTFFFSLSNCSQPSSQYRTDRLLDAVRHVKDTPVIFVWSKAQIILSSPIQDVTYAVSFFIPSTTPFHALDLAYVMLRFSDMHIRECDYRRFNLISATYNIDMTGTSGVLLYDNRLKSAYRKARASARAAGGNIASVLHGLDVAVSTWPALTDLDNAPAIVAGLITRAQ